MPDKASVRHRILSARDAMPPEDRREKSHAAAARLLELPEYRAAGTVLLYVNFRSEVATRRVIESALSEGKRVLIPKVDRKGRRLRLFEVHDMARDLEAGYMGIYEPVEGAARPAEPAEADLVVLPGVGFDEGGRRLGYGGGYYDRLIEGLRPGVRLVALAFDVQVVDEIPSEEHDKRVHKIVTETKVIEARWT